MVRSIRQTRQQLCTPRFEMLEGRRLLSGGGEEHPAPAGLHEGMLIVRGTDANDTIKLSTDGTNLTVTPNGHATSYAMNHVKHVIVYGGAGNDDLEVDNSNGKFTLGVVLIGGAGDDTLVGGAGNDYLLGNDDNDSCVGSAGADIMSGGAGADNMVGGDGADRIDGDDGNDVITGGSGNDNLHGEGGNDRLDGGAGNDKLDGGAGADHVDGGSGNNHCNGGSGHDQIVFHPGHDVVPGSEKRDEVHTGADNGGGDTGGLGGAVGSTTGGVSDTGSTSTGNPTDVKTTGRK